jgi:hypothetical protein
MENIHFFAAAYIAFILVFFAYTANLQKKIKSLQTQVDQLKNKS